MQTRTIIKDSLKYVLLSLSRVLPEKAIPILLYHSIDHSEMWDSVSPVAFSNQMDYLYKKGYRAISLDEIADYMNNSGRKKLSRVLAITFDDGYRSIYQYAMPILQKCGFTASVFLPTKYIGKYSEWTNPSAPLLTWNEIRAMEKNGILFGSHGHSHRDLTVLTEEQVRAELETSKKILEDKLGKPIAYIAYPFSQSNKVIEDLALKCGYRISFSAIGVSERRMQSMQKDISVIFRRSVIKKDNMLSFEFVLANTYHYYFDLQRLLGVSKG